MKEDRKSLICNLLICLGIVLVFLGMFVIANYTPDSYLCFNVSWREQFDHFLSLGRVFSALFWFVFSRTNYNFMCSVSGVVAIIELAISIYLLRKVILSITKNKGILTFVLSAVIVLNVFAIELIVWYEKCVLMFSVLTCIVAVYYLNKAMLENKIKYYVFSFISMILANFAYQGTVGIFISLAILLVIKYSKNIKDFIKYNVISFGIYGVSAIINFLYIKIFFNTERLVAAQDLKTKIFEIYKQTKNLLINTCGILPKYTFVIALILVSLAFVIYTFMEKKNIKIKLLNLFFLIYVIGVNILVSVLPQLFQDYISIMPRNAYSLGAIVGLVSLLTCIRFEDIKIQERVFNTILVILLVIQWYNYMVLIKDHYTTMYMDKVNAELIATEILNYEEETGNTIDTVYTCKDKNYSAMYDGIRPIGEGSYKAFFSVWGVRGILDQALGRELQVDESKNAEYNAYFLEKDWNNFSTEQLIFDINVLYLCIF